MLLKEKSFLFPQSNSIHGGGCVCRYKSVNFCLLVSQTKVGLFTNNMFLYTVGGSLLGQLLIVYMPHLQVLFQMEALTSLDLDFLFCLCSSVLHLDGVRKLMRDCSSVSPDTGSQPQWLMSSTLASHDSSLPTGRF